MESKYAINQYESPKPETNLADVVFRIISACRQIFIAIKYQLFAMRSGAGVMKIAIVFLVGILLYRGFAPRRSTFDLGNDTGILGFSLAPAEPATLRDIAVKEYVERYGKVAIEEQSRYGIPASISMAQGIIESRCGESTLAENNNNHFGIKCFSKNCPKEHCSNFTDDTHKDFFRKYNSSWESWREHSKLLSQARYEPLKKYGNDYEKWAKGLQSLGYATDDSYAEKLITVIEKYNLNDLDD
jgi:Mannosyl-glycoprotein endo-beta-N-acetylglucosaminidase